VKKIWALRRFLPRWRTAEVIVLMLVAAVLDGLSVGLVLPFLSLLSAPAEAVQQHRLLPIFVAVMENAGVGFTVGSVLVLIAVVTLIKTMVRFRADTLAILLVERMQVTVRVKSVETLLAVSPTFYSHVRSGDLTHTLLDDVEKTGAAVMYALKLVAQGAMIAVWVAVMAVFSWQLTIMSLLLAACVTGLLRFRVAYSERFGSEMAAAKQALSGRVVELLAGLKVTWLHAREESEVARVRSLALGVNNATYRFWRNSNVVNVAGENLATIGMLAVVYFSVMRLRMDMATLVAFFYVLSKVLPQVHRINVVRTEMLGYSAHAGNVLRLIDADDKPMLADGTREASPLRERVEFRDVSFEYRRGEPVLTGVRLSIPRGQTIAIAGASGAGKSTLVDLLARFYDPTHGEITVDGVSLRELQRASWRRRLSVVSQDVFLFRDTIAANIAYGSNRLDASTIERAARMAHAHEFIVELPSGYETIVGERGFTLSGGQRQRLSLARALARMPDILILDEGTNALDAESEHLIFDAIDRLAGQLTIVVIGHRLAPLRNASRIYVIDGGRIVESGTHDELLSLAGQYARFCELQRI
jgi:ABC-type multidrug transport system fused ATPase/permease subunit